MQKNINISSIKSIYFIGIGGIGMSAIARYFHFLGKKVSGYDRAVTSLTEQLENEGIQIHYEDNVALAPKDADVVVYTPAIPNDHQELRFYQSNQYLVLKRSDILEIITAHTFNICIAGTHGKTTTTTMISHILRDTGFGCNAFLGGVSANYNTNFWSSTNQVCVIEADEYDRSFLKLSPDIAIITSADADHLDIYGTEENVKQAFRDFVAKIKEGGLLVKKFAVDRKMSASRTLSYSLQNESATVHATNLTLQDGGYTFDVVLPDSVIDALQLNMGGMHNVENMVAAVAVAHSLEIEPDKIRNAVASFKGVKRRFEYIIKKKEIVFIDDYAHHPQELRALIQGVKSLFRQKRCTVIFQPHLFSRTRDFAADFAEVLDTADRVILLPIYPARETPIAGVDSNAILNLMQSESKSVMTKDGLLDWLQQVFLRNRNMEFGEVIVTAGAGNIDQLVEPIKRILEK